jgi:ADP-ribose pyrophosphatase YjhB (NUDIX family)
MADHPHADNPHAGHTHAEHPTRAYAERELAEGEVRAARALGRGPDGRSTDIESGLGTPRWIAAGLNFCSRCGAEMAERVPAGEQRARMECPGCGFIAYVNPRLVVTTLPVTAEGDVVLIRRGIEPGLGSWAQPGGFLEIDETVTEGAIRETLEETGLLVEPGALVGLYSRLEAGVVTLVFEARIVGGEPTTSVESLEVRPYPPAAIPWPEIAFKTTWYALRDWLARHHPNIDPPGDFHRPEAF